MQEQDSSASNNPYEPSQHPAQPVLLPRVPLGVRTYAALLVVGGVSLLLTTAWLWFADDNDVSTPAFYAIFLLVACVFGYTGFQLFRGQLWAYKAGMILYVLQIPVITSSPITYLAVSGFGLILSLSRTADIDFNFNFYFGGNFQLWLESGAQGWLAGVNLIGIFGARCLYEAHPKRLRGGEDVDADLPPLPDVLAKLTELRKTAFIPVTENGDGELTDSKFSGTPLLTKENPWPVCPSCNNKMQLFLQLDLSDNELDLDYPIDSGLLQFFYCVSSEPLCEVVCESYAPFSKATVIRVVPPGTGVAESPPEDHFPAKRIVGWQVTDDYPNWEELREHGVELPDNEEAVLSENYPVPRDKVAGWPYWVQAVEYPDCRKCSAKMQYLLQIDSEVNLPYMFGDVGCGHITYCKTHPDEMSFHWACH